MKIISSGDSLEVSGNESFSMRSGRIPSGQPINRQHFEWGYVNWLIEPDKQVDDRMSSGEVVIYPHCGEPEHTHFAEEQMIYVIAGRGIQTIDGQSTLMSMGDSFYLQPNCRHSLTNNFNEDLRLLCIYNHRRATAADLDFDNSVEVEPSTPDITSLIDPKITKRLMDNISHSLDLSLNLYDLSGRLLVTSGRQNPLCSKMAATGKHCQKQLNRVFEWVSINNNSSFFHCCGFVYTIVIPVICGRKTVGYLKCGEFYISPDDQSAMEKYVKDNFGFTSGAEIKQLLDLIQVEKKSRLRSAVESVSTLVRYIVDSGLEAIRRKELDDSRLNVINGKMAAATLEKALREADFKLLNSQINPRFLFNTLSVISQMAYMEGAHKAVDLVCSLADLTRAALRKANSLVTLSEECALLNDYLQIQKIRFKKRLEVKFNIEPGLETVNLPILTLQPLVENAITQGLSESRMNNFKVDILIKRLEGGRVSICLKDNGPGFAPDEIYGRSGVGLKSVEARLRHCFNDRFSLEMKSSPGQGSVVEIIIMETS